MDSTAPAKSGRSAAGFLESGTSGRAHSRPAAAIGMLIRNTDPHQKWASSNPPMIGPRAKPTPLVPAQKPIAQPPFPGVTEHVGDDRQGGRHQQRGTDALDARPGGRQHRHRAGEGRPGRTAGEGQQAGQERPLAADPVGQASRGQQQPGEDQRVGIDDRLELARRRARSRTSVGSATFRTVLSRLTISRETQSTASASHRRGNGAAWAGPGTGVLRVSVAMLSADAGPRRSAGPSGLIPGHRSRAPVKSGPCVCPTRNCPRPDPRDRPVARGAPRHPGPGQGELPPGPAGRAAGGRPTRRSPPTRPSFPASWPTSYVVRALAATRPDLGSAAGHRRRQAHRERRVPPAALPRVHRPARRAAGHARRPAP